MSQQKDDNEDNDDDYGKKEDDHDYSKEVIRRTWAMTTAIMELVRALIMRTVMTMMRVRMNTLKNKDGSDCTTVSV